MNPDVDTVKRMYENSPNFGEADEITFSRKPKTSPVPATAPSIDYSRLATITIWLLISSTLVSSLILTFQMGMAAIANHQANQELKVKEAQLAQIKEATSLCSTFGGNDGTD
jgi:hypothetical protein